MPACSVKESVLVGINVVVAGGNIVIVCAKDIREKINAMYRRTKETILAETTTKHINWFHHLKSITSVIF